METTGIKNLLQRIFKGMRIKGIVVELKSDMLLLQTNRALDSLGYKISNAIETSEDSNAAMREIEEFVLELADTLTDEFSTFLCDHLTGRMRWFLRKNLSQETLIILRGL